MFPPSLFFFLQQDKCCKYEQVQILESVCVSLTCYFSLWRLFIRNSHSDPNLVVLILSHRDRIPVRFCEYSDLIILLDHYYNLEDLSSKTFKNTHYAKPL